MLVVWLTTILWYQCEYILIALNFQFCVLLFTKSKIIIKICQIKSMLFYVQYREMDQGSWI